MSSDSIKIKNICDKEKMQFIKRPKIFSRNKSDMFVVIKHVLEKIDKLKKYRYVVLLQPTSPLREKNLVLNGIKALNKNKKKFDMLIHVSQLDDYTGRVINKKWISDYSINTRAQDIKNKYKPTGCLFIYKRELFEKKNFDKKVKQMALVSKVKDWVNIDYEKDFVLLNYILSKKNIYKYLF